MDTFIVELMVTEKCNLGCTYCYVSNRNKSMTPQTLDKVIDEIHFYMRAQDCKNYAISYFGGEPLENFELVKYAHSKFKNDPLCKSENIISNLTLLTQEIVDYIKKENITVSFSFDGLGSEISRPLLPVKENNGYKDIMDLYNDKFPLIRQITNACHYVVSPDNIHLMPKNIDFFLSKGFTNVGMCLVRDNIWTKKDIEKYRFYLRETVDKYIKILNKGTFFDFGLITLYMIDSLYGLMGNKRDFSCFAGTNGCGVTASGEFYACARFGTKGIFKYSHDIDFRKFRQDFKDLLSKTKCKKCEIYYLCNRGCTYSELKNNGEPLDSICELFKITYAEMARLVHELRKNKVLRDYLHNYFSQPHG